MSDDTKPSDEAYTAVARSKADFCTCGCARFDDDGTRYYMFDDACGVTLEEARAEQARMDSADEVTDEMMAAFFKVMNWKIDEGVAISGFTQKGAILDDDSFKEAVEAALKARPKG